jgi:hypothetical protein
MPGRRNRANCALYLQLRAWVAAAITVIAAAALSLSGAPAGASAAAVAARPAARAASAGPGAGLVSEAQALRQARAAGKRVAVTAATTPDSTLTANPDGTLTLTQESVSVRKRVAGRWVPLDATLRRNGDGSVSPTVTTSGLRLSGGGTSPLAVMTEDGASLSLTAPFRLPAPVLSGQVATYPGVLPGVDLQVTADDQGGFSEVLIVRSAAAAADPALRHLAFATRTGGGISLRADAAGNLTAVTRGGRALFTAPAPRMWDSAPAPAGAPAVTNPHTGQRLDRRTGMPLASSTAGPGVAARVMRVGVRAAGRTLTLTPAASLLDGASVHYPVFIDPTYAAGSTEQAWTQVDSGFPTTSYWKESGYLQVGDCPASISPPGSCNGMGVARSFVAMSIPSTLYTAHIYSSTVYFTEEVAPSCSAREVDLYWTGGIGSGTTWNAQPGRDSKVASATVAYGYPGCNPASVGFGITSLITQAASGKWGNVTMGLLAASESDELSWKQFSHTVTMTTTYDHAPATPTALSSSPASACSGSTTVGNGDVILYAGVSDPDGGALSASFTSYNTSTKATLDNASVTATSGATAALRIPQATLDAAAAGAVTGFSWNVKVSDGTLSSGTSVTCSFKFDPTIPGPPSINGCEDTTGTIGTPVSFAVTPPSSGTAPASYDVQLNGAAPATVTATSGDATATVAPTRGTDILTVTAISAGGNVGGTATCIFTAAAASPAADGDLTGDGIPDLITPGGPGTGLPTGLWLARGQAGPGQTVGDGQIIPTGIDIGSEGNGAFADYSPADFNGTQVITGQFTDRGLQDSLIYYPSGTYAGQGVVMDGTGDGSVLDNQDAANATPIDPMNFIAPDPYGDIPLQVANGYNADPNDDPAYPDLITVTGDATDGYYLEYYQNAGETGSYLASVPLLATSTPDGTMDWNNWTIATMAEPTGAVDMFLYDSSTGALWLWQNLSIDDTDGTASYTPYQLSANWNLGTLAELRAADITGTGPAVWAVTTAGTVTAYTVTGLGGTPAVTAGTAQALIAAAHNWQLGDGTSGQASNAADTGSAGTPLPLTGNSGATWDTSDLFNPDVAFNGTTGAMTSTAPALTATSSFTVSAWVKPNTTSGVFLGQTSTSTSCMGLAVNPATVNGVTYGYYTFGMTTANSTTPTWIKATSGASVQLGTWSHVTATYNAPAKLMTLYVDGTLAATAVPSATWSSGCNTFTLGRFTDGGAATRYFNGKIADIQVWPGTALTPTQIAFHGSYYLQNGNTGLCIDDSSQYGLRGYACEYNAPSYANGYQSWIVYVDSAGHWQLQNENTGLCIDDSSQYGLRGYACNASSYTNGYQQWIPTGSNPFQLQNVNTGLCIDDSSQYGLRGYACNASSYTNGYQKWTTGS